MTNYRTPGVYFEWLDARNRAIGPLRTDIAGFVGIAERGPLHQPVRVESWVQFVSAFGQHIPQGYLAYAVEGFFANGGRTCWVVRVADPAGARPATLDLANAQGRAVLRLTAATGFVAPHTLDAAADTAEAAPARRWADPGLWGRNMRVAVLRVGAQRFSLDLSLPGGAHELWRDLSLDPCDARFVERLLNDPLAGSRLVAAECLDQAGESPAVTAQHLSGGDDGLAALRPQHLSGVRGGGAHAADAATGRWGLAALELIDEVSIVAIPDIMPKPLAEVRYKPVPPNCQVPELPEREWRRAPTLALNNARAWPPSFDSATILELQRELVAHCELLTDRVALLDPDIQEVDQTAIVRRRREFDTSYAALYYPWLMVPDPLHLAGLLRAVPPSGHIAGLYARSDLRIGVHKPPANEAIDGALDLATTYLDRLRTPPALRRLRAGGEVLGGSDDITHGDLNDQQVNLVRAYPGRGLRVMGARTLSSDTRLRYVNVRRLLIMIKEAIEAQTQWIVFEPHNPELWRAIDRVVRNFLDGLWRRGMLDGATAAQAYEVACDQRTNPPEEIERGRVICRIGVQPPWPAEFVIVRIGKTETSVEIIEQPGGM